MLPAAVKVFLPYVIGFAAVSYGAYCIYDLGSDNANAEWQKRWDDQVKKLEAEAAKSQIEDLEKEANWLKQINKVRDDGKITQDRMATDLANSNDSANRLLNQVARLAASARKGCTNPGPTQGSNAAGAAANMLADMSTGFDEAAREISKFADESRSAGLMCQQIHSIIKNPH
jgi:hypothetical protein